MNHPLPPGFSTAALHLHVAANCTLGSLVGIAHRLYYCAGHHYPDEITRLVADMRKAVDDLDSKLAAVEVTLPVVIEVAA